MTLSVNHIVGTHHDDSKDWVLKVVNGLIDQDEDENAARANAVKVELENALVDSKTTQGDIYLLVRWLFQHYSARNVELVKVGLLPNDYLAQVERKQWWRKILHMFASSRVQ